MDDAHGQTDSFISLLTHLQLGDWEKRKNAALVESKWLALQLSNTFKGWKLLAAHCTPTAKGTFLHRAAMHTTTIKDRLAREREE